MMKSITRMTRLRTFHRLLLNSGDEIMTNREKENVNKITSSISSLSSLSSYSNKYNPDDNNNDKKLTI